MSENEAKIYLKKTLNFSDSDFIKLDLFEKSLLKYNKRYNLISKNTENTIWSRHILDSAQLLRFFSTNVDANLVDLGSGAGFPGLIIAIFNKNTGFHVKLYEKSSVKRDFLKKMNKELDLKLDIEDNVYEGTIDADIIVSRAFKKLDKMISISREIAKKPHKMIILKGKNAQEEINSISLDNNYSYKLEKSITSTDSKIIVVNVR